MRTLEIALLQSPTVWHDPEANRILFTNAIAELQPEVKLVVLPEMVPSYPPICHVYSQYAGAIRACRLYERIA